MKEILNRIFGFLAANDFPALLQKIGKLEWSQVMGSPYTWLVILPILTYLLWTKKFKLITAAVSFFLFLLLIQKTISPVGDTLSFHDLLIFLSGTVILIGLNFYLLFVRQ